MEKKMPENFYWGGSVSSFQTEGARNEGGKGLCIYDVRPVNPEFAGWDVAIDAYHRYDEDIALMKEMGFNFYRFSICWSRIIPNGTLDEPVNEEGVAFYNNLIDKLIAAGIEPMITLVHFDMPYHLVKNYNGFASRYVVDCFERYAQVCIERFGDRVKHWMSFNEQNLHAQMIRVSNAEVVPEGVHPAKHLYQVNHNVFIAHCKAVRALRQMQPDAQFCGMGAVTNVYPYSNTPKNYLFAWQAYNYANGFHADVFAHGKYPDYMVAYLENRGWMPKFEEEDEELLKYTVDYMAFSYYRSDTLSEGEFDYDRPFHEIYGEHKVNNPNLDRNEWNWEIDPVGFRWTMNDLHTRTGLPVFVLENGIGWREDLDENGEVNDDYRINYHRDHIQEMKKAMLEDGVPCLGYITWGPIDIPASMADMSKRYGFVFVNRTNKDLRDLRRVPKKSFAWVKKAFESNGEDLD